MTERVPIHPGGLRAWLRRMPGCLLVLVLGHAVCPAKDVDGAGALYFEERVRPVLAEHCYSCHSAGSEDLKSGLRLDTASGIRQGGHLGELLVAGNPDSSLIVQAVRRTHKEIRMPPKTELPGKLVSVIEEWVSRGAPLPLEEKAVAGARARGANHWAFQPVRKVAPPRVGQGDWAHSPVDAFVAARHELEGVQPAPRAGKRTLIRRATLDLTGLPPTPGEVAAFITDDSPQAFARLVDRLLDSPEYGRRWGRHWLDVVRYADTGGDNSDFPIPEMSLYRNYVIDAFNEDLPYDRFLKEQLAGDLLARRTDDPGEYRRLVTATTFIAMARRFVDDLNERYFSLVLGDSIAAIGQSMLGMTLQCARCHDHKFDPIPTEDYYALAGFLESTRWPTPGREGRPFPINFVSLSPRSEDIERVERLNRALFAYRKEVGRVGDEAGDFMEANRRIHELRQEIELREKYGRPTGELKAELAGKQEELAAIDLEKADDYLRLLEEMNAVRREFGVAYAVTDKEEPVDSKILIRGEYKRKGRTVQRGFLSAIAGDAKPAIPEDGSGRLELAEWIASPENPLTARVMVNRIWHWHFGRGIVKSTGNFGTLGEEPSHPELLDYLAAEFVRSGWSVKAMHRLLMNSATYRMAWLPDEAGPPGDSDNRLFWRFDRRRLEAEAIRDSILAVSGRLRKETLEMMPFPPLKAWYYSQHEPYECRIDHEYRSVYLPTTRLRKHPYLTLFDGANPVASTGERRSSTVPLQSLYLMNSRFIDDQAASFAVRLGEEAESDSGRIGRAFELAYQRPVSQPELHAVRNRIERLRKRLKQANLSETEIGSRVWTAFARSILMSNELIYLD